MRAGRITISFLLLLLLATPLLTLTFLQARQLYIKHTLEERLEAHLLKTFFVPQNKWIQLNKREIIVYNRLFDLKECRATATGFIVSGVFDDDETAVVRQLDAACTSNASKDTPVFAQFFQLLHGLFFQEKMQTLVALAPQPQLFQPPISQLPLCHKQVLHPPPRCLA